MGWMMGRMLTGPVLPLLPAGAEEIAPGVGVLTSADGGGLVMVHGLATFAWDSADEAGGRPPGGRRGRRPPAAPGRGAAGCGGGPPARGGGGRAAGGGGDGAGAGAGVAGVAPARRGPKGASKLTPELVARIGGLDAAGQALRQIAAATGVSTFTVRNALGRVAVTHTG